MKIRITDLARSVIFLLFHLACSLAISGESTFYFQASFPARRSSVSLEIKNAGPGISLTLTPRRLSWTSRGIGRSGRVRWSLPLERSHSFSIQERAEELSFILGTKVMARLPIPAGPIRVQPGKSAGAEITHARRQPAGAVDFADDFMRTEEGSARQWQVARGNWALASPTQLAFTASPFRYQAKPGKQAIAEAGHLFWRDYFLQASVRIPDQRTSPGLVFYSRGTASKFLFRWNAREKQFEALRLHGSESEVLARVHGSLEPKQWYRLGVAVGGTAARCSVDETRVLLFQSPYLSEGKIGLYADAPEQPVDFDDVQVRSLPFSPSRFDKMGPAEFVSWARTLEPHTETVNTTFQNDPYMQNWAGPAAGWYAEGNGTSTYRYFAHFYRGFELGIPVSCFTDASLQTVKLPGCNLTASVKGQACELALTSRNSRFLEVTVPSNSGRIGIAWEPGQIQIVDSHGTVHQAKAPPYDAPVLSLGWASGAEAWEDIRLRSYGRYGYTFYRAPTDWWRSTGKWDAYSRWSCRPEWTFFGGKGQQTAIIWNKRSFPENVLFSVFAANSMVSMRPPFYAGVSLNFTICGDGKNPFSGYSLEIGGWNRPSTRLYRQGRIVAETDQALIPRLPKDFHRWWFPIQLGRERNRVFAQFQGRTVIEFTDPNPIEGDRLGMWSQGCGLSAARVDVFYSTEGRMHTPLRASEELRTELDGWKSLDGEFGAALSRRREKGRSFIRLTNQTVGGTFAAAAPGCPVDLSRTPRLRLRYRLSEKTKANLYFHVHDTWLALQLTGPAKSNFPSALVGSIPGARLDGAWHKVNLALLSLIKDYFPLRKNFVVDEVRFGLLDSDDYLGVGLSGNPAGATADFAEFDWRKNRTGNRPPSPTRARPSRTAPSREAADDFELDFGRWRSFGGPEGAYLFRDTSTAASGRASLQLYKNTHGGSFGASWNVTPFSLQRFPRIQFDYRMPSDVRMGILLQVSGQWLSILLSPDPAAGHRWNQPIYVIQRDGQWHHAEIDLLRLARSHLHLDGEMVVGHFLFCDQSESAPNGYRGNHRGARYWLDNVQLRPAEKDRNSARQAPPASILQTPIISVTYPDRSLYQDFEGGPMPWRDWCEGAVLRVPALGAGNHCARLFGYKPSAHFATMMVPGTIDLQRFPYVSFNYRFDPEAAIGFALNLDDFFYYLPFSREVFVEKLKQERADQYLTRLVPGCLADGQWHRAEFNVLEFLQARFPNRKQFLIRGWRSQHMGGRIPVGTSCDFDNLSFHSRRAGTVVISWALPPGASSARYCLDRNPRTVPDGTPDRPEHRLAIPLGPGPHFFHLRFRGRDGAWQNTFHTPIHLESP